MSVQDVEPNLSNKPFSERMSQGHAHLQQPCCQVRSSTLMDLAVAASYLQSGILGVYIQHNRG